MVLVCSIMIVVRSCATHKELNVSMIVVPSMVEVGMVKTMDREYSLQLERL